MTDHNAAAHSDHGHDDHGHHIMPVKTYYLIFGWLVVLTVITVAAAFVDFTFGSISLNFPIAMAIATTKASLVIMFFMHVMYSSKLVKMWIGASIVFFILLVAGILMDYFSRSGGYLAFYQPHL